MTGRRICLVTTELRGVTAGGIGAAVLSLGRELRDDGWDVTFLVAGPGADLLARGEGDLSAALDVGHVLGTEDGRFVDVVRPVPDWAFGSDLAAIADRAARVLERLAQEQHFDVVEFPDYQGLAWAVLRRRWLLGGPLDRTALVVRLHGTLEVCMEHELLPMRNHRQRTTFALERSALAHADHIVAASPDVADWYASRYGLDRSRFVVAALPFDPIHPTPPPSLPAGERDAARHVVFIGKVQRLKGVDLFVDAAVELLSTACGSWRFTVIGGDTVDARSGGSLLTAMQRRIPSNLRDRIVFTGQLSHPEIAEVLGTADLVVLPNRVETFCLVAYELLSTGLPAVLSDIPAFDTVARTRESLGLATARFSGDASALASAIAHAPARSPDATPVDVEMIRHGSATAYRDLGVQPDPAPRPTAPSATLVSVVVPYYEMQDYVEATVASILRSSHTALEVIVVDDGSPSDAARERLDALRVGWDADGRVRVVRRPNGGLGAARNTGIEHARGEYVLPVDSDDLLDADMIATLAGALDRAPELDAVACYTAFFEDEATLEPVDWVVPYDLDPVLITIENRAGVATSMFRRSALDAVRYDERLWAFEDWSLWWSLAAGGRRAAVVPEVLFRYRRRPGSMVKSVTPDSWATLLELIADRHRDHLATHAVDVYGMVMSSFVGTRAELHAQRAASPSPVLPEQAIEWYREARALRTGRAAQLVDTVRRIVRRTRRPWRAASFDVTVTARPTTPGGPAEVWFAGVRLEGSNVYLPVRGDGWTPRPGPGPLLEQVAVATDDGASVRIRALGERVGLLFMQHPWTTGVDVTVDGVTSGVDLRRPDGSSWAELVVTRSGPIEAVRVLDGLV